MVKIFYCDRCGKELTTKLTPDGKIPDNFEEFFINGNEHLDSFEKAFFEGVIDSGNIKLKNLIRPSHLCKSCCEGYNKIVDKTNIEIKSYMKSDKKEMKKRPKFGFLK